MNTALPPLRVRHLGRQAYQDTLALQRGLVRERASGAGDDVLLLVEHDPVFTLGRSRRSAGNVLVAGDTPVVQVERGGDVTWHGPGQLVGYPIVALGEGERDVHAVLRHLEDALIALLARMGLEGERKAGHTGVWCRGRKLGSIGVAVQGWVTFHGFSLNVDCDLAWFQRINPCGLSSDVMASVASLGGRVPEPETLRAWCASDVSRALGRRPS